MAASYRKSWQVRRNIFKPVLPSRRRPDSPNKHPDSQSLGLAHSLHIEIYRILEKIYHSVQAIIFIILFTTKLSLFLLCSYFIKLPTFRSSITFVFFLTSDSG